MGNALNNLNNDNIKGFCSSCTLDEKEIEEKAVSDIGKSKNIPLVMNHNTKSNIKYIHKEVQLHEYNDGSKFIGEINISTNVKEGYGKYEDKQVSYKGEFFKDQYNGFGIYANLSKNTTFLGEYKNNKKSGYGILSSIDGKYSYIGNWKSNIQEGIGTEILPDKTIYQGEFSKGKKNGLGIYYFPNGKQYEGYFVNGIIEGYGYLKGDNGDFYEGFWENNTYNGYGHLKMNNVVYKGYFKNDIKFGYGIMHSIEDLENENLKEVKGLQLVGKWIENKLDGWVLGINIKSKEVEKLFKYKEDKLISTITDEEKIKSKVENNRECEALKVFFINIMK